MSGEPLGRVFNKLDPAGCRIVRLPQKVWLFGGPGKFTTRGWEGPESLRESFWHQGLNGVPPSGDHWTKHLDFPEQHEDWWAYSGYDDLLVFERDACHLARAVILFAESPGSLAELGALAVDDTIIDRLVVVVQSKYLQPEQRRSFLSLGPLQRVDSRNGRCVISVHNGTVLPPDDFATVMQFVDQWLPQVPKTEKFKPKNPTHRLLLIADLIDLLLVCKPDELRADLHHFGVELKSDELSRFASLLDFFGLIRVELRGKEPFYTRRVDSDAAWIDYTAIEGRFDRSHFKTERQLLIEADMRLRSILGRRP